MMSLEAMPRSKPTARADRDIAIVAEACRYIEARTGEDGEDGPVSLAELGRHCAMSPFHLQRLFKRVMGVTPRQYADARRLQRLRAGLQEGEGVAAATYGAGFGSSSRVYERAGPLLGMTPATYAKGGKGARIAYSIADSELGRLLVAATPRGVCFVAIGRDDAKLVKELIQEFPAADAMTEDDSALGGAVNAILAHLDGKTPHVDLPLDIRATAFQRQVWQTLARIPPGETRSYGDIARALGNPGAARAVGGACAANPVALVVPCHRALPQTGGTGGYRWGGDVKSAILGKEKMHKPRAAAAGSRAP